MTTLVNYLKCLKNKIETILHQISGVYRQGKYLLILFLSSQKTWNWHLTRILPENKLCLLNILENTTNKILVSILILVINRMIYSELWILLER
jgi:hypothetical protein